MKTLDMSYHRNGVSGVPFNVGYDPDSNSLSFAWALSDDDNPRDDDTVTVDLDSLPPLPKSGPKRKNVFRGFWVKYCDSIELPGGHYLIRFKSDQGDFVGLYSPDVARQWGGIAFAAICVDLLKAHGVKFGLNSWRGDAYVETLRDVLPA